MSSALEIEERAAALLARLDADPGSAELQAEVRSWCALDARHEVAYLRLQAAWRHLNRIQALGSYRRATVHLDPPAAIPARKQRSGIAWAAAVAAALLGLVALWWLTRLYGIARPMLVATQIGGYERRLLPDGSTLEINTDSRLEVTFQRNLREIRLLQGEARFTVARDVGRPFVVRVRGASVRALGTDFSIKVSDKDTQILVSEGSVRLQDASTQLSASGPQADIVRSGQLATVTARSARIRTLAPQEVEARLAWDKGLLLFEGDPLDEVAEQFNRYNTTKLRIRDPRAARLKIDGTFKATNIDAFLTLLEQGFPVDIDRSGSAVDIRARQQADSN